MIERTTFDLRIAAHTTATAAVNQTAWQRQGGPQRRDIRAALAAALVALAARLAPERADAVPFGQAEPQQPAAA